MWGAGMTHVLHMVRDNNFSQGNAGIIVYWDFIFPIALIILFILQQRLPTVKRV